MKYIKRYYNYINYKRELKRRQFQWVRAKTIIGL